MDLERRDPSALGASRGVYGVKAGLGWRILLIFGILFSLGTAVVSVFALPRLSSVVVCTLPMLILAAVFTKIFRDALASRDAELRMFENGFTYSSDGKRQTCLWEDVHDIRRDRRSHELLWVEKKDGEMIIFPDDGLPETRLIADAFDAYVADPKSRDKLGADWDDYRAEILEVRED